MTREEALKKAINIVAYFEAHFAKSKKARETAANIIEALEQEPCEDAISRQAAIDAADKIIERDTSGNNDVVNAMIAWSEYIRHLPSAQPKQRIGHWIYNPYLSTHWADVYECSECKEGRSKIDCYNGTYLDEYCPKCGARMEEEE